MASDSAPLPATGSPTAGALESRSDDRLDVEAKPEPATAAETESTDAVEPVRGAADDAPAVGRNDGS